MTSADIKKRLDLTSTMLSARQGSGGLHDNMNRELVAIQASQETAYQLAKLNEYIEAGATITIRPPKDGRKFRLDT